MTELFGRLPGAFHRAYEEAWPLPDGYRTRRALYNLYHMLNHWNLFGGAYTGQVLGLCQVLLDRDQARGPRGRGAGVIAPAITVTLSCLAKPTPSGRVGDK